MTIKKGIKVKVLAGKDKKKEKKDEVKKWYQD